MPHANIARSLVALLAIAPALLLPGRGAAAPLPDTPCVGDCQQRLAVGIVDLVQGVAIATGNLDVDACRGFDRNEDDAVSIDELIAGVGNALRGCAASTGECGDRRTGGEEQCDDGNRRPGDGCSSGCTIEQPGELDQAWLGYQGPCGGNSGSLNIGNGAPIGQVFVPTSAVIQSIEVVIASAVASGRPTGGTLGVNLRLDGIDGLVVASTTAAIDPPRSGAVHHRFDFRSPVALDPTHAYVIELIDQEEKFLWQSGQGNTGAGCGLTGYGAGNAITSGEANPGDDFLFQTFGAIEPRCGDGLITAEEQCDDGNRRAGDGCDSSCALEVGE